MPETTPLDKTGPYAGGVLDPEVHGRLVADLANIAAEAGIPAHWMSRPLADTCSAVEVDWVRQYRFHAPNGLSGLVLANKHLDPDAETRMAALTGALVRNFVAARLMPLNELLVHAHNGEVPEVSCLLVPNFFGGKTSTKLAGGGPNWRFSVLLDVLMARHAAGRQTVLWVPDPAALDTEYGEATGKHLAAHYRRVQV